MRLLLDTHVLIWAVAAPNRLLADVRAMMETHGQERWVSAVSVWEMNILTRKGRVAISAPVRQWMSRAQLQMDLREVPLDIEIALAAGEMAFDHADPADHLLAATAKVLGMTLVTADRRLLARKDIAVMAAG